MDYYGFYTGQIFDAYKHLGCHYEDGKATFTVFAPAAKKVTLFGDFSDWKEVEMTTIYNGQFWQAKVENIKEGMLYKYRIYQGNGRIINRCDPYGFGMELRPNTASIIRDMKKYKFNDSEWMKKRTDCIDQPLNIYEIHAGSWKKAPEAEDENAWYTYSELADKLIPYLKENGYNYVELMPLHEHPSDESWGYQATGFYSPTSRYGTADQLKEFVDKCHQNNIGVILDFVIVHFAVDDYGLWNFDGTPIYEYPHSDIGKSQWGSLNFNHSRGEVQSFLQSNACYWLSEYHFDGLRIDAISNIIYWQGDSNRGINTNATKFLKNMNQYIKEKYPSVMLMAEDSSSYPGVTSKSSENGLGFDYKWDMGWMNDTLDFFRTNPEYRTMDYHKITFSMMYYYSENFMLPLSHDEVVHGKATIIKKMNGDYDDKFPQARALYLYMMTHPGKKLNFMGNEIAIFREWDEDKEVDWNILKFPIHDAFHKYIKELNHIYLGCPALSKLDYNPQGFEWLECDDEENVLYAYERTDGNQRMIIVLNLSNKSLAKYPLEVKDASELRLVISTDMECYGGKEKLQNGDIFKAKSEVLGNINVSLNNDLGKGNKKSQESISKKNKTVEENKNLFEIDLPAFSGKLFLV